MKKIWKISRDTSQLAVLRGYFEEFLSQLDMDQICKSRMILCIDEAAANIIEHTSTNNSHEPIEEFSIEANTDNTSIIVTITDNGIEYNPTKGKEVDLKKHLHSGKKGGLGVFIMKAHLDIFEYKYENQCNVLTLGMNFK